MPTQRHLLYSIAPMLACIIMIHACRKTDQDAPPPTGPVTQQEINNWILDSMRYFYLWNQYLPQQADAQASIPFFNTLKYKDDRFSLIYNPDDLSTYSRSMLYTYGIDFNVIALPPAAEAIGVIKFVISGSAPAMQGVKRGDYFTHINGTALTSTNAATLSAKLLEAGEGSLTLAAINSDTIEEGNVIPLHSQLIGEYPLYAQQVWTIGGKKTGYLFYNYFNDGYNGSLIDAFKQFRNEGVTELILDLRYNPGGSVAASALLAAMIAPGINEQSTFVKYSGNSHMGQRSISFQTALSFPEGGSPLAFNALADSRLSLQRVLILSGPQTASAAELLINNLKPFTSVIQIGQTTFGKDKGAITVRDERTPKRIPWMLLPITYNLSNANGTGGYTNGITPQYQVDEMSHQPLAPIGDASDPLIAKAIAVLNGNGRQAPTTPEHMTRSFFDSRQQAAANNIVTIPRSLIK